MLDVASPQSKSGRDEHMKLTTKDTVEKKSNKLNNAKTPTYEMVLQPCANITNPVRPLHIDSALKDRLLACYCEPQAKLHSAINSK
jgi:hypothetical protein